MAWIESHQALGGHRKLRRLASILGISKAQAVGHLHYLWWWCLDNAPDGNLGDLTDEEIADVSEWPAIERKALATALRECGWIDDGHVHDWHAYAGKLIEMRERGKAANAARQARFRERNALRNAEVTRYVTPSNGPTVPNPTIRSTSKSTLVLAGDDDAKPDDQKQKRPAVAGPASDEEWLASLEGNPTYSGINIRQEFGKMATWCATNGKQPSRRRFVNWINRVDRPMKGPNGTKPVQPNPRNLHVCPKAPGQLKPSEVIARREAERMAAEMDRAQREQSEGGDHGA
jgi:hypothetical protein